MKCLTTPMPLRLGVVVSGPVPVRPEAGIARIDGMEYVPMSSIPTPCTGVCTLDAAGRCHGCLRTADEIAGWLRMTDSQRDRLMQVELPARQAARA